MAIETRANLDSASLVVKNETGIAQNTANRVGTLFENLSDSSVLLKERGCVSLSTSSAYSFTPAASDTPEKLTYAMSAVVSTAYNVAEESSPKIEWTGAGSLPYRVSALLNFSGTSNREYYFYIARNGVVDDTSKVSVHLHSSDPHSAYLELYAEGAGEYEIWIEQKGSINQVDFINGQLSLMSV
jgi:hypothetical protein